MSKPRLSTNRTKFIYYITVDEVVDQETLVQYAHQYLGMPYPTVAERKALGKVLKDFFRDYPDADYRCLTDVVTWAKAKNKRLLAPQLFGSYRYAYRDGYMRLLERGGRTNDDETLSRLLTSVNDPDVRDRMIRAATASERDALYQQYLTETDGAEPEDEEVDDPLLKKYGIGYGRPVRFKISVTDPDMYGTVVGSSGDKLVVYHNGMKLDLYPEFVKIRKDGEWVGL